jgi:hypothetical protein
MASTSTFSKLRRNINASKAASVASDTDFEDSVILTDSEISACRQEYAVSPHTPLSQDF